jgi:hypothetical protein
MIQVCSLESAKAGTSRPGQCFNIGRGFLLPLTGDVDYIKLIQMRRQHELTKYFQIVLWLKNQCMAASAKAQGDQLARTGQLC